MEFTFANRVSGLKPSAIREILKVSGHPDFISFAIGNPAPDTFPVSEIRGIAADILENRAEAALQYGVSEGYTPLREQTLSRMRGKYGVGNEFDECVILSGGQQGMDLAAKAILNEGDIIFVESPSFIGALNAFRSYNAVLIGVPVDEHGMDTDALARLLEVYPNAKMIYTIPTFQNPTGATMSLPRRKHLLELAKKHDVYILEDSPYFELRISGEYVPPIKSFDDEGRVIYCGSYSKVIAPGIRVGYMIAHSEIIKRVLVGKQVSDVHTNQFFQMVISDFLNKHDIDRHIAKCAELYGRKRDRMLSCMEEHFKGKAVWNRPDGGLFLWGALPEGYDSSDFCLIAKERNVAVIAGCHLFADPTVKQCGFRLNYSVPSDAQIDRGIEILGKLLNEYVK